MSSEKLNKVRAYEKLHGDKVPIEERPVFHVTPATGWMNDPNGFSYYQGEVHLFYQYHPYDLNWGLMHWGHVKTKDFIKWERLPAALVPEEEYDHAGCFSGSALELPDGRQMLMYTGVQEKEEDGEIQRREVQCIAFGDGVDYERSESNPVLTKDNLPEGNSASDFRDPKVWWDEREKCFYAVAVNCMANGSGAVLLFSSRNACDWEYVTTLDQSDNRLGGMWECPDFFELDGRQVLLVSPMKMRAQGMDFHNGNEVICLLGTYDSKTHEFTREAVLPVDHGLDYYAAQTMQMPDGRRIYIAWMQAWESSTFKPDHAKWFSMQTLPRELHVVDGKLIQNPVRELETYRCNAEAYTGQRVTGRSVFPGISGRVLDMTVKIYAAEGKKYEEITVGFAENEAYGSFVSYRPKDGILCLDRTNSGFCYNIVSRRESLVREKDGVLKLRFVLDRFSAEIFVNDGEQVLSACIYTPQEADGISFSVKGEAVVDIEKYDIVV
ncbi:MAG: glycoside hydrolase family 32 protein [Clostridiales bacterium]|nr:glycoside hydrolase family 32 protein [Clostridiales bacterium]